MSSHIDLEKSIVDAMESRDFVRAATLVLDGFGSEILGYLEARLRSKQDAEEVFARFAEILWRGLPTLEIRVSMRSYVYALARNSAHRYLARDVRAARQTVPISQVSGFEEIAAKVRTVTPAYMQTETKLAIARLRESLSEEEQTLLSLRIDRGLEWLELAEVLASSPDEDLARGAARLRQQYQTVKKKLVRLARAEGVI